MIRFERCTRTIPSCALAAAGLVALAGALPVVAQAGTWEDGAPLPSPVANNAVATHARNGTTFVYSFMGIDSTKAWSGIGTWARRLNTVTNQWEDLPAVPAAEGKIAA